MCSRLSLFLNPNLECLKRDDDDDDDCSGTYINFLKSSASNSAIFQSTTY